jgi:hypothetical protein
MKEEITEKYERVKEHVKKHREGYFVGALGLAGITCLIMRDVTYRSIGRGIPVTANRGIPVIGKRIAIGSISYISSNRQGPPSWVIRCLETGEIFTAQRLAALQMGLPENEISRHLNGAIDHVRGFHFERICLAA